MVVPWKATPGPPANEFCYFVGIRLPWEIIQEMTLRNLHTPKKKRGVRTPPLFSQGCQLDEPIRKEFGPFFWAGGKEFPHAIRHPSMPSIRSSTPTRPWIPSAASSPFSFSCPMAQRRTEDGEGRYTQRGDNTWVFVVMMFFLELGEKKLERNGQNNKTEGSCVIWNLCLKQVSIRMDGWWSQLLPWKWCFFVGKRLVSGLDALLIQQWKACKWRFKKNITLPETNIAPQMDGWHTIVSFWDGLFSGANC